MNLELQQVNRVFKQKDYSVEALSQVDFSLQPGDQVMVVGESGSGKSTLLNILGLLDQRFEGTYLLNGKTLKAFSKKDLAVFRNQEFGYIFQDYALIENETVYENVKVPLLYSATARSLYKSTIEKALRQVGMTDKFNVQVKHLSGGERQRVAIARALVNQPTVILADEPTGSLDSKNRHIVLDILYSYLDESKILVFVTHDLEVNRRGNQRVALIHQGIISEISE